MATASKRTDGGKQFEMKGVNGVLCSQMLRDYYIHNLANESNLNASKETKKIVRQVIPYLLSLATTAEINALSAQQPDRATEQWDA